MTLNEDRRRALADAGLELLALQGARGLTHRAVDTVAVVPVGTTSNYFRTRSALFIGLVNRIRERLAPDPDVLDALASRTPSPELFADYLRDIVSRLTANRSVAIALFELRLEAARNPSVAELMSAWQQENFRGDVAFNSAAGLPGGRAEVALFHYAIDGLLFDRLTSPIDQDTSTDDIVDAFVAGLLAR